MIPPRVYNTKERGTMEFLVYREGETYVGVCLTFDIVEEGSDPVLLMKSIKESADLHLQTVTKENLSEDLLNRYAPQEYWDKYFQALENLKKQPSPENSRGGLVVSPYDQGPVSQFA